jgi:hypothetical protein
MSPSDPATPAKPQRLHDLRGAYANFRSVLELLKSGYRFDDDAGPALAQLERALQNLNREIRALEQEWRE